MKPSILGWLIAILLMSSSASARADNCGPTIRLWQGFVTASLITVPKRGDLTPKLAYDLGVAREWEKCHNFLALGFAIGVDTEGDVGPAIFLAEGSHWFSDKIAAGVNLVGWVDVSFARGWEAIGAAFGPKLTIRRGGGINLGIALNGVLQYQAVGPREREVAIGGMVELEFAGDLKNIKEKIKAMFQKRN